MIDLAKIIEGKIKELEAKIKEVNDIAVVKVKQYKVLEVEIKKLATEMDTKKRTIAELKSLFDLDKKEPTVVK